MANLPWRIRNLMLAGSNKWKGVEAPRNASDDEKREVTNRPGPPILVAKEGKWDPGCFKAVTGWWSIVIRPVIRDPWLLNTWYVASTYHATRLKIRSGFSPPQTKNVHYPKATVIRFILSFQRKKDRFLTLGFGWRNPIFILYFFISPPKKNKQANQNLKNNPTLPPKKTTKKEKSQPGDSSRDLFIPKGWRLP